MWAMVVKEFRQLFRDKRTVGMLVGLPVLLLVVFGYAANFGVSKISTVVVGPQAAQTATQLRAPFDVTEIDPGGNRATVESRLRDGKAVVGIVSGKDAISALMDGTQLFSVQAAKAAFAKMAQASAANGGKTPTIDAEVLYNPDLKTSWIMIPGLTGLILLIVGTLITCLGVVRERQSGTIEQLAVMPFRPWDVIFGKILPYLLLASFDLVAIVVLGTALFGVPFVGNAATFCIGALLFLLVALGMGVLISTVSQNQGQAIQLAIMFAIPQILLSGLIFPVDAMGAGVRWIAYVLPLSYFIQISRGVMLKAESIAALWFPLAILLVMAFVALGGAVLRFRRDLAPNTRQDPLEGPERQAATS